MARLGLRLETGTLTSQNIRRLASVAEEQGYDTVWVPEGVTNSLAELAAVASSTKRIKLATGILTVYSRTPTLLAMSAGGLDAMSNKRFILGLGVGHRGAIEDTHGVAFDQPMARIRETVDIVRRLLNGENVDFNGKVFRLRDSRLGFTPVRTKIPIYLAALGPKMIQLAGEIADGVLLNWASPDYIKKVMPHLQHGADQAGRKLEDIDVACYLRTAVVDDVEKALPAARRYIARYCATPFYQKYFGEMGFAEEAAAAAKALALGDGKGAVAAISDAMLNELAIIGSAEHCRRNVAAIKARGLDMPVIAPFKIGDDAMESFHATVTAFSGS